jgi:hypothetical protein
MAERGKIRYNDLTSHWELSNDAGITYSNIVVEGHLHVGADITDATSDMIPEKMVKRDAVGNIRVNTLLTNLSALSDSTLSIRDIPGIPSQASLSPGLSIGGIDSYFRVSVQDGVDDVNLLWNTSQPSNFGTYNAGPAARIAFNAIDNAASYTFFTGADNGTSIDWTSYADITKYGLRIGDNLLVPSIHLKQDGDAEFSGVVYAQSFEIQSSGTLKHKVTPTSINAVQLINATTIYEYEYRKDPKQRTKIGILAEETDKILSSQSQDRLDMTNAIGVLMKAVQELSHKVNTLEKALRESS